MEDRPEAIVTAQAQPAALAADEVAATGANADDQEKAKQPHERVAAPQTVISVERGSDTLNPIVETVNREIIELIGTSITDLADENGWAFLGDVGTLIAKKKPDFDPRNYGFVKLTPLIRSLDMFELDIRETSQFHIKHVYVRNRRRPNE
jgi:Fe-S-cluster formation regulator IscX/YfhJ